MFKSLKARFILIAVLALGSIWLLAQRGITLGLDLQGGTHLALEVSDPQGTLSAAQRADAIDRGLQIIRTRIDELGVAEPSIQKVGKERIIVELPGATAEEQQRAKDVIQRTAFLKFQIVRPLTDLEPILPRIDRVVAQSLAAAPTTAGASDSTPAAQQPAQQPAGAVGGLFQKAPGDSAAADSARRDSAAKADTAGNAAVASTDSVSDKPFSSLLQPTGGVGQFAVAQENVAKVERYLAMPEVQGLIPRTLQLRWLVQPANPTPQEQQYRLLYLLESRTMITGEYLEDAQALRDPQLGQPIVTFQFNRQGGRKFEQATGAHVGDFMAIVLDEKVYSAPVIESQIGDRGEIRMSGSTIEQARDLALVLRAGALPAPIKIVEERSIGPSLGADSIRNGQIAGIVGISLLIVIMIGYYRMSGVLAVLALILYALYTLSLLSMVGAALTFPGIAGFVLSIAMAVDTNVLVYERTREELAAGRTVRTAINAGFHHALPAIIDSHATTILSSLILFEVGTGPVRGFAVTLALGLVASLFTAIFVTRTFFLTWLERRPTATKLSI
jgi:preprotein translocase subunit SecD